MTNEQPETESKRKDPLRGLAFGVAVALALVTPGMESGIPYKIGQGLGVWLFAGIVPGLIRLVAKLARKTAPSRIIYFVHTGLVVLLGGVLALSSLSSSGSYARSAPNGAADFSVDELLQAFPGMSDQAKRVFQQKVSGMSDDETVAFLWQLMAEGETLFSDADKSEMTAFYWKAVETLTPKEQMFIAKMNLKMSQGQGYSATDQQKSSVLVQKGFGNLSEKDNARYLEKRGKAIELALLKPDAALRQFKSTYPPSASSVTEMTAEQKQKRMQEIMEKALSLLPEKDQVRFMELQLTPADQLTKAQYAERVKYSEKIISLLSEDEMREMMELTGDKLKDQ